MDNLEKQLNNLPKMKMGARADARIRLALLAAIYKKRYANIFEVLRQPVFAYARNIIVAFLLAAIIALPVYSYASPSVTRNSFLYPIKQSIEELELATAVSPAAKAKVYDKLATRRLKEAAALSIRNQEQSAEHIRQAADEATQLRNQALEQVMNISDKSKAINTVQGIAVSDAKKSEQLLKVAANIGVDSEDSTLESVALALKKFNYNRDAAEASAEENSPQQAAIADPAATPDKAESASSTDQAAPESQKISPAPQIKNKPDSQPAQERKTKVQNSLENIKNNLSSLKEEYQQNQPDNEKAEILINKIENKVNKIEASLDDEELDDVEDIAEKTEALSAYGKAFIGMHIGQEKDKSRNGKKNK